MGYRSMKTKRYIVLAFILSLVSSISSSQIRVNLTDTILKSGSATGMQLSVKIDSLQTVTYYQSGKAIARLDSGRDFVAMSIYGQGWQYIYADVAIKSRPIIRTDSTGLYIASVQELERLFVSEVKYQRKAQTFPDSLVIIPDRAIILTSSHASTTKKTTITYLNMIF